MNVVSIVRSTTRWVALQSALFRQFCGVDPIYINHGPNHEAMQCDFDELGVVSHVIPECTDNNPSISHSHALEWVCEHYLRRTSEPLCIVDMDIFPMRPVSLDGILGDYHAAGCVVMPTPDHCHLWPGLLFIASDAPARERLKLNAFRLTSGHWLDSGGESLMWEREYHPRVKRLPGRPLVAAIDLPIDMQADYDEQYVFQVKAGDFFHLHGATNWMRMPASVQESREQLAERFLRSLV